MSLCPYCSQLFSRKDAMERHVLNSCGKSDVKRKELKCLRCNKTYRRKDVFDRHLKTCRIMKKKEESVQADDQGPPPKKQRCDTCDVDVISMHAHLRSAKHKDKLCIPEDEYTQIIASVYKSRIVSYRIFSRKEFLTPKEFMWDVKERYIHIIACSQSTLKAAVKVNLELFGEYVKWPVKDGESEEATETKSFNTRNRVIDYDSDDKSKAYDSFVEEISAKADEFEEKGSGWSISKVLYLEVNINKYQPLKGSSYIPLPKWVRKKSACVNVQNKDEACFFWSIVSALYPVSSNTNRPSSYPHYEEVLDISGVSLPVSFKGINRFEKLNNISINVFEIDENTIAGPIYRTREKRDKHINLLFIENGDKCHYCWIKNISALIGSQLSKNEHKIFVCDSCLLIFHDEEKLMRHTKQGCANVKTELPSDNILKFKNYRNILRAPVVVYADFEALLLPINGCPPDKNSSYTMNYQRHEPYSFGYFIKCAYDDSLSKFVTYCGEDCVGEFLKSLESELLPYVERMRTVEPMTPLTPEQEQAFQAATNCHICGGALGDDRVRDHDHLTSDYRSAAHNSCNLNFKITSVIPIVIHNFSKYDSHFLVKKLENCDIKIIPKNKENFISITSKKHGSLKLDLRFIDSYRFLASSLDKLASNLEPHQFREIKAHCDGPFELLTKKGVFPYDYMDDWGKLEETSLPPQSCFFNQLNGIGISDEQYAHAQEVWNVFNIQTLKEYSDLYLKTDVILLADVFENFRDICINTYKLDPAHYYSAPGLSWDAMLYASKVEMELLTDYEMIKFISEAIRGGLSQCCTKYATANNKYIKTFDSNKPSEYIIYLDANNQYGWAMSQSLPLKDFRWLSREEIDNLNVMETTSDDSTGYILEVDIDYPEDLHDLHNDLCFCLENRVPEPSTSTKPKLLSTLYNKRKYVIHYMNLKQAITAGLQLRNVHRVLAFIQSPWLKMYIDLNTELRTKAKNSFEKDFYKLMNNVVFGKTVENTENRVDVRLVNSWESEGKRLGARALISRLNFQSLTAITENLSVIQLRPNVIKYDKPICVGFSVLELSKTIMYDFHYNYMIPKYGENVRLLYTDTDSFIYHIKTDDFYNDIKPDLHARFDTSDYAEDNVYGLPLVNKKVVGMFKDECSKTVITEFIGIRSKCYYLGMENDEEIKKIKGIKRSVVSNEVSRDNFFECVNTSDLSQYRTMNVIRSKAHDLFSQTLNKIVLNNNDDKRFIIPTGNRFETLAWGHKKIDKKCIV